MLNTINRIIVGLILTGLLLVLEAQSFGQHRPPREVREKRERVLEKTIRVDQAKKWSQPKETFRSVTETKPAERKITERKPASRGGKPVDKTSKWKGIKENFNQSSQSGGRGGGNDRGGNPPAERGGNPPSGRGLKEKFNEAARPTNLPPGTKRGSSTKGESPQNVPSGPKFKPRGF